VFSSIFAEDNDCQLELQLVAGFAGKALLSRTAGRNGLHLQPNRLTKASTFEGELNPLIRAALTRFSSSTHPSPWFSATCGSCRYQVFGRRRQGTQRLGHFRYLYLSERFPIRITSSADNELMYSAFFEISGRAKPVGTIPQG